jgi:SAM-dependent methyltransferase
MDRLVESTRPKSRIYEPRAGYALAASAYETWHWFQFWRHNEVPIVKRWVAGLAPGAILDAGSGTGLYRPLLEDMGYRVVAADVSAEMLVIQGRKNPGAPRVQAAIEALPFRAATFDYVLCTRVLSHIRTLTPVFRQFARVTKPNAALMITDVHPEHRYSDMSISTNGERISIQTYKHPLGDVRTSVESNGFALLEYNEYRLSDLVWTPPVDRFANIYDDPGRPIFYTCFLRRT